MSDNSAATSELDRLHEINRRPLASRMLGYISLSGPGFLQGAMTLGGGSAVASLAIGANFGYEYLWVQPVSMVIGCIMLFALSYQTLSTGERPYVAMRRHVGFSLAMLWALAAIVSSIIWGFAQYPIGVGMIEDIILSLSGFAVGRDNPGLHNAYFFVLAIGIYAVVAFTAWNYSKGGPFIRIVETSLKLMIALIIICFAAVVIGFTLKGRIDWAGVLLGFIPRSFPSDSKGLTTLMGALGAAVGINMTFVYGYTLLRRGWGREHRTLSRYDITMGLVIPYGIVVSLISIGCASGLYPLAKPLEVEAHLLATEARLAAVSDPALATTLSGQLARVSSLTAEAARLAGEDQKFAKSGRLYRQAEAGLSGIDRALREAGPAGPIPAETQDRINSLMRARNDLIKPVAAARAFAESGLGEVFGRIIFSLGILGMTANALIMHMLCCGFACSEIFRFPIGSMKYRLCCLITTPAVFGVFFWHLYGMYIGLITSTICAFLLPIAYIGWFVMNNRRAYLGADLLQGRVRLLSNLAMGLCIVVVVTALAYTSWIKIGAMLS